jgi:hypothetical protein
MTQVDIAKLKRIRGAIASTLDHVPEKSADGLPPAYNSLRGQAIEALPAGLRPEVEQIAPVVEFFTGVGARGQIEGIRGGRQAHAHLAALKGWLDTVIDAG